MCLLSRVFCVHFNSRATDLKDCLCGDMKYEIYDQGVADFSVITKTEGNGLVMLSHSNTDFLPSRDLTLRFGDA